MVEGEIQGNAAVRQTVAQCAAVFYNIGILRQSPRRGITFQALQYEGAGRAMSTALDTGVKRFLLVSANGANRDGSAYQRTKSLTEEYLWSIDLVGTVFRPSVMFGDPRGTMEFATQLRDEMIRSPMPAPLFYHGLPNTILALAQCGHDRLTGKAKDHFDSPVAKPLDHQIRCCFRSH